MLILNINMIIQIINTKFKHKINTKKSKRENLKFKEITNK